MTKTKRNEVKNDLHSPLKKTENSLSSFSKTNSVTGRIRKIGNSKGILLSNSMIRELGVADDAEVIVTTEKGHIIIKPAENKRKINTDLSTWEAQFKAAIKNGDKPEKDLFEGMENKFDKEEW
ncbi:MAG: hypothetical protein WKG06_30200 [Segetibacter sp.]